MTIKESIKYCKKLVELPYNKFNLDNYLEVIDTDVKFESTSNDTPIKMMSGYHKNAGLIKTGSGNNKILLVGKGLLFDAGGYDIKPSGQMNDMMTDMAGMATALALSKIFNKIDTVSAIATNFIGNSKLLPGDEIKIGKKTVKINNTDAEGRLVLAEALANTNQDNKIIVTIATLTGAVAHAVGDKAVGVFTPNDKLWKRYEESAKQANEYAWRLPLWDYLEKENFKGNKFKNLIHSRPGASTAALFVKQFVKEPNNWIHLDIASASWDSKKEQATGVPIKTLVNFIKKINGKE